MIPVRDVIPTRTAPRATLLLLAGLVAAYAWPAVRGWWLPWLAHAVVFWLFGPALEDRLGRARFIATTVVCLGAGAVAASAAGERDTWMAAAGAAGAGVQAAYLALFPRSRVLTLVPVWVGVEIEDVPAWILTVLWALVQGAAAWSRAAWSSDLGPWGLLAAAAAGGATGALCASLLRRPERMRIEWWDPPRGRP